MACGHAVPADTKSASAMHAFELAASSSRILSELIQQATTILGSLSGSKSSDLKAMINLCTDFRQLLQPVVPRGMGLLAELDACIVCMTNGASYHLSLSTAPMAPPSPADNDTFAEQIQTKLDELLISIGKWQSGLGHFDVLRRSICEPAVYPIEKPLRFMLTLASTAEPVFVEDCVDAEDVARLLIDTTSALWAMLTEHQLDDPDVWVSRCAIFQSAWWSWGPNSTVVLANSTCQFILKRGTACKLVL